MIREESRWFAFFIKSNLTDICQLRQFKVKGNENKLPNLNSFYLQQVLGLEPSEEKKLKV